MTRGRDGSGAEVSESQYVYDYCYSFPGLLAHIYILSLLSLLFTQNNVISSPYARIFVFLEPKFGIRGGGVQGGGGEGGGRDFFLKGCGISRGKYNRVIHIYTYKRRVKILRYMSKSFF